MSRKKEATKRSARALDPSGKLFKDILKIMETGEAPSKKQAIGLLHRFADVIESNPAGAGFMVRQVAAAATLGISFG